MTFKLVRYRGIQGNLLHQDTSYRSCTALKAPRNSATYITNCHIQSNLYITNCRGPRNLFVIYDIRYSMKFFCFISGSWDMIVVCLPVCCLSVYYPGFQLGGHFDISQGTRSGIWGPKKVLSLVDCAG